MSVLALNSEAQYLKGVGQKNAPLLGKLGLHTVGDVLFNIPRRYEDRRNLPRIRDLKIGQTATIKGRLIDLDARPLRSRKLIVRAVINDGTGSVALTWFNQPWIRKRFEGYRGEVIAFGTAKAGSHGIEFNSPEYEVLDEDSDTDDFARVMPVYSLTEGLYQRTLRLAATAALDSCLSRVTDALPLRVRQEVGLVDIQSALREIHRPSTLESAFEGRRRLVFEEFLYLQLALELNRADIAEELGIAFPIDALIAGEQVVVKAGRIAETTATGRRAATVTVPGPVGSLFHELGAESRDGVPLWDQIHKMLPFELTGAQKRAIGEIWSDMKRPHPMNRLVQGDVGSGKTAVAACAILAAIRGGYQAALMAPTEILAEQHAASLTRLFEPLGIEVVLLIGKLNSNQRKQARLRAATGSGHAFVGTHALIEEDVEFHNLGLAVIDEQHRFGVMQRAALRDKGRSMPDVLVMTATPIPRTLMITTFGELDVSVIDEMPPGRRAIKTHARPPGARPTVYQAVRELVDQGRQAYFVCPLVSESELMQAHAAEELFERLRGHVYPDLRVALLHGKLKSAEKEAVMDGFRRHEADVLVSTTVIEVGVDVPNATVIVVEDANRFGLAQLHQLRGRVGRGEHQSYCILVADASTEDARKRMDILTRTTDGFVIAEEDLRLRGPGDVIGTRQSGQADFRFGNLVQDAMLMEMARDVAIACVARDPGLKNPEWQQARDRIKERRSRSTLVTLS